MSLLITVCSLLLIAYIFDLSASKTRIPTVILLLIMGWSVKYGSELIGIAIPDLNPILPILGTIGLILIVMEGSLELEVTREKLPFIAKSLIMALLPLIIFSFGFTYILNHYFNVGFKLALSNAIPLSIISSAIAIPSAQQLDREKKEFIIYESSISDIVGVVFFNFITLNDEIDSHSIGHFFLEIGLILLIALFATLLLTLLISKIKHHVKFLPILLTIVLLYAIAKVYHLPGLIIILVFGLCLKNLSNFKKNRLLEWLNPVQLNREIKKFEAITAEFAFLIRVLFFLVFGFLISIQDVINPTTFLMAVSLAISIYLIRLLFLIVLKMNVFPLVFIAPRGLITILLFLSLPQELHIEQVTNSLLIQLILITSLMMMIGSIFYKKGTKDVVTSN